MTTLRAAFEASQIDTIGPTTPFADVERCAQVLGSELKDAQRHTRLAARDELVAQLDEGGKDAPSDVIHAALGLGHDERDDRDDASATSGTQLAIEVAHDADVFCDDRGDPHAAWVDDDGKRRVTKTKSQAVSSWISRQVYVRSEKRWTASPDALARAVQVMDAEASMQAPRTLHNRFAVVDDAVWIDMADGRRAIRVEPGRWCIDHDPPILFRSPSHQRPLATPLEGGGDLGRILDFVHLTGEDDRLLFLVWCVALARCDLQRPCLVLHGPPGAAKTTAARFARSLLDPSAADAVSIPTKRDELAQLLFNHAVPVFDNLSTIPVWQSDMLCLAVTGGGFTKRQLYTVEDDVVFTFQRGIVMTGVGVPANRPDLLDRCLLLELSHIHEGDRRQEEELRREFEDSQPAILGGLLDTLSDAMRIAPELPRGPWLPRMASFAAFGAAVSEALGYGATAFVDAYRRNLGDQVDEVIENSVLALGLLDLVKSKPEAQTADGWEVSAAGLLADLNLERTEPDRPKEWPKRPNQLSKELKYLEDALRKAGLSILRPARTAAGRRLVLRWEGERNPESSSSASSSSWDIDDWGDLDAP